MNLYIWRHNKTYHSHSMIDEPCVLNEFYLDALAVVAAPDQETALAMLEARGEGWRVEDLRKLEQRSCPWTREASYSRRSAAVSTTCKGRDRSPITKKENFA